MRFSNQLFFIPLLLLLTFGACSRQALAPQNPRVAIQLFDNQGADAGDRWMSALFAYSMTYGLGNNAQMAPSIVNDAEGWRTLGSGRLVSGTIRREGQAIRVEARLTDTASSAVLRRFEDVVTEDKLLLCGSRMLESLLGVKPTIPVYEAAIWKAFAQAQTPASVTGIIAFVERYPSFAPAYPILAEMYLRSGKRAEALALTSRLPAGADPLSRVQLAVAVAETPQAKLKALVELAKLRMGEPRIYAELAMLAANEGNWTLAAAQYKDLTLLEAGKVEWWNSLGYAEANLNHLSAAAAALNEYRRLSPKEPNPIDSLGEIYYMNREFKKAGQYFDEGSQLSPTFQNGVAWRKAAFSYYFAGDLKKADERFETWMKQVLINTPPSTQSFERAMWLTRTGRAKQGEALLTKEAAETTGDQKLMAELHLAMIQFGLTGKRPQPAAVAAWNANLKDAKMRNEFSIFALMSQAVENEGQLAAKINAAVSQPQLKSLRVELLAAATKLMSAPPKKTPKVFPLPNTADTPIDALVLRWHLAVIP